MDKNIINIVKGLLYGQALGDAMGLATEYMSKEEIENKYYSNGIKLDNEFKFDHIVQDYHRKTWKKGDWTDDTDTMILIAQSIIEDCGYVSGYSFRKKLLAWYESGFPECDDTTSHGTGYTMGMFWGDIENNNDDLSLTAIRMCIYNPSYPFKLRSNGGLMRTSILAFSSKLKNEIINNTIINCAITHADPYCVTSAIFINLLIKNLTDNQKIINMDEIIDMSYNDSVEFIKTYTLTYNKKISNILRMLDENDPFANVIRESCEKNFRLIDINDLLNELKFYTNVCQYKELNLNDSVSYTMLPVGVTVIALKKLHTASFITDKSNLWIEIIMEIIREGGDADTNCAVAGAVCGAYIGYESLPVNLINELTYKKFFDKITQDFINVSVKNNNI